MCGQRHWCGLPPRQCDTTTHLWVGSKCWLSYFEYCKCSGVTSRLPVRCCMISRLLARCEEPYSLVRSSTTLRRRTITTTTTTCTFHCHFQNDWLKKECYNIKTKQITLRSIYLQKMMRPVSIHPLQRTKQHRCHRLTRMCHERDRGNLLLPQQAMQNNERQRTRNKVFLHRKQQKKKTVPHILCGTIHLVIQEMGNGKLFCCSTTENKERETIVLIFAIVFMNVVLNVK